MLVKRNRNGMPGGPTGCDAGCHYDTVSTPGRPMPTAASGLRQRAHHRLDCPKHRPEPPKDTLSNFNDVRFS